MGQNGEKQISAKADMETTRGKGERAPPILRSVAQHPKSRELYVSGGANHVSMAKQKKPKEIV